MSDADTSTNSKDGTAANRESAFDTALADVRTSYLASSVPQALAASTLAQMRAAHEAAHREAAAASQPTLQCSQRAQRAQHVQAVDRIASAFRWLREAASNRWSAALAGSLATVVVATASAPLWISFFRESVEVATPFMLVNPSPQTASLDVSNMLRVNVTREAMLDFGIPVPPQRLAESVKAEMLIGGQGEVLAVRFVEAEKQKRWRWQFQ